MNAMFRMSDKGSSGAANDKEYLVKEQILLWLFSIAASVLFYICILFVVHFVYHPDPAVIAKAAHKIVYKGPIHPEPIESLRFRLGIVTLIPSFLVFFILFSSFWKATYSDGTTRTPQIVAINIPPKTEVHRACLLAAPAPDAVIRGTTPRMKAKEVIRIGRNRSLAPSLAAVNNSIPSSCLSLANSKIRIAFLATRPINIINQI